MKVKIVNRKRFIRSTGILLAIIIFTVIIFIATKVFSHKELRYKTKYVSRRENIWKIATNEQKNNEYYKNEEVRNIIEDLKNINNLNTSNLYTNQELIIPIL